MDLNSLYGLIKSNPTEDDCMQYLEDQLWQGGVVSPFDPTSIVYKLKAPHVYRCKNTGKDFTVRTGTIFHGTKMPLKKWFLAIYLLNRSKKGVPSTQLAKDLGITQCTAWHILHKIRHCYRFENQSILGCKSGIVEIDETFVGGKNKNRSWKKKVKNSQGRSFKDKTPVLGMLERRGKSVGRVVKNTTAKELTPHILETVCEFATLYTDEWKGYNAVGKIYSRFYVDHGKCQYVNGNVHTNTIEGAWSILKRSIIGVYHQVSRKFLQKYVDEFVFLYNYRNFTEQDKFNLVIINPKYGLTYKKLAA